MSIRSRTEGFTLTEVLVGVAILGLMGSVSLGVFARALKSRDQAEKITRHYHQIRTAMLRMSREISSSFLSAHRSCEDARTKTIFLGKRSSGGMRLDFTSFSHTKFRVDANESDQNELSYYIENNASIADGETASVLMRREQNRIDNEPDEGGKEQVLAENVTELEFQFYDAKEDRWEDTWDASNRDFKNRLPAFVKILFKTKGPNQKEETFVTKTRTVVRDRIHIPGTGFAPCLND